MLRDWTDSYAFEKLTADAERLFVRLIMKADDFGRYHSSPTAISSGCFPLVGNLRSNDITRWLDELSTTGLILRYMVNGRAYLAIVDFKQRLRTMEPKFPTPEGKEWNWQPTKTDVGQLSVNCPTDDGLREEKRREEKRAAFSFDQLIIPSSLNKGTFTNEFQSWVTFRMKNGGCKDWMNLFSGQLKQCEEWGLEGSMSSLRTSLINHYQGLFPPRGFVKKSTPSKMPTAAEAAK
jgi:hypothetical protein